MIRIVRRPALKILAVAALTLGVLAWRSPQAPAPTAEVTRRWVQEFGMISPGPSQTLRLQVAHLGAIFPPDPAAPAGSANPYPPNPCAVTLAFFDSQGALLGQPTTLTLAPGTSTAAELLFDLAAAGAHPPNPCRASVWVTQLVPQGEFPPNPCASTLELLGTQSGLVTVHALPAVQRALPAVQ